MTLDSKIDLKRIELESRKMVESQGARKIAPGSEKIAIIEGPPTMNGIPHIGHVRGRIIKDMWYRFKVLQGYDVQYSAGWDTQGLPVELQAQKELGMQSSKSEITGDRIEELINECKRLVKSYNEKWITVDDLLGMSVDNDTAYWTHRDSYIEREWQVLKRALELGVLREDYTVIAYCPKCQTSLSHTEVAQSYKQVRDHSLYYKVKLEGKDESLVVWTTMPFTLVTDALVGVHPEEEYCRIEAGGEILIVGKTRLEEFLKDAKIEEHKVISSIKGSELDGAKYIHPLLKDIPELEKLAKTTGYHCVVAEDFVETETGSGLVHISPANGEQDIKVARKRKVEVFNPINDEVKFTEQAGKYAGSFVRDTDSKIIDDLKDCNALVHAGNIRHSYPHCWRSGDALVWLARRGWFYILDDIGKMTLEAASNVEYYFEQPRNRFIGIVSESHPWCISRERFWGTPLPVWTCASCDHKTWLHSRADIVKAASDLPDGPDFELHMPWIDHIKVKCESCQSTETTRERYVLDTWHNSGSAPHSSLDDESYQKLVPTPFLSEGIDQTRGWAYTLLVENVILAGRPQAPYSSFLFQGHVLDNKGNKMSKSEGNVIDAKEILSSKPVDLIRFYFMWKSSPIEALNFDDKELLTRPYQVLSTLYNLHTYYEQNSTFDKFEAGAGLGSIKDGVLSLADNWILSRLQHTIKSVTEFLEKCQIHMAMRQIEAFVINDLSQTYVPMTRSELWEDDPEKLSRRHAIYAVIEHILCTVNTLLHPVCPFTTRYLQQSVFGNTYPMISQTWPKYDEKYVNKNLEESFEIIAQAVSVCNSARSAAKLKRRWPLKEVTLVVGIKKAGLVEPVRNILCEQLNIENVNILESDAKLAGLERVRALQSLSLPISVNLSLDRKSCAPKVRELLPKLVAEFERTDPDKVADSLAQHQEYGIDIEGKHLLLDTNDIIVKTMATGDNVAIDRDGVCTILSTVRSDEMVCKGLVRDLARRLQALRKERGYNPTDVLESASVQGLDETQESMLKDHLEQIAFLVRVSKVVLGNDPNAKYEKGDIDGQPIEIAVG